MAAGTRLDIWLWSSRFFRSRALAKQAIEKGRVEVNGESAKPAKLLHVGDKLTIVRGDDRFEVEALALNANRATASVAQLNYRESDSSRTAREAAAEQRRMARAGYSQPPTKPDKRARRLIRALGDIDAF
jgi:ribosome-associated heat shock protein Hsp15